MQNNINCDLVIVGSGAAGLAAAVTAAHQGLDVVILEKSDVIGGATAWSGGWMWVPFNPLAKRAGINESPDNVRTYLKHELGEKYQAEMIDMFLKYGTQMVSFFEDNTELCFEEGNGIPDIHGNVPGAAEGGHQLIAAPFNANSLGKKSLGTIRKPMRETSFIGMPIQAGADLSAFLNVTRSFKSFLHVAKRMSRHFYDLIVYGRASHLVNGQALIARLLKSANSLGVRTFTETKATSLIYKSNKVIGVVATYQEKTITIKSKRGVLLASGGFPNDKGRRGKHFPRTPTGDEHWALPPTSCSGDGLRMAESIGANFDTDLVCPVAWAPVSLVPYSDGTIGHFPHIIDRAKPGVIGVLRSGKRFVNEADGYYDYVDAMIKTVPDGEDVASWLICDHKTLRRYGLGFVRPSPLPFKSWISKGYLKAGSTIEKLATACNIDSAELLQTVNKTNLDARNGIDSVFGKGSTPYNKKMGDPSNQANPCIGEIVTPPFYAIKIVPGSFGTFAGLKTNEYAEVLNVKGDPIKGLYAAGSDMASIMGGYYPSGGINLGPAMTFGYIAALSCADKINPNIAS